MRFVSIALLFSMPAIGFCQVPALEVGSQEAHRYMLKQQQAAQERAEQNRKWRADWDAAKKLFAIKPATTEPSQIGQVKTDFSVGDVGLFDRFEISVSQVIDDQNLLLSIGDKSVWLTGYPSTGLVDGQSVRLLGAMRVSGSRSYESVIGSVRTVPVIEFLDSDESRRFYEKLELEAEAERQAAQDLLYRTWNLSNGRSVEGKVDSIKNGIVTFIDRNGKQRRLYLRLFSEAQQQLMKQDLGLTN